MLVRNKQNFIFSFNSFNKLRRLDLKHMYLKRKNYSIFLENGSFSMNKVEINFVNFFNKLSSIKKKWKHYLLKKQYLKKYRFKKRKQRIINYMKKYIISKNLINYGKLLNNFSIVYSNIYINNSGYNSNYFELLNIKIRFLQNYIK